MNPELAHCHVTWFYWHHFTWYWPWRPWKKYMFSCVATLQLFLRYTRGITNLWHFPEDVMKGWKTLPLTHSSASVVSRMLLVGSFFRWSFTACTIVMLLYNSPGHSLMSIAKPCQGDTHTHTEWVSVLSDIPPGSCILSNVMLPHIYLYSHDSNNKPVGRKVHL